MSLSYDFVPFIGYKRFEEKDFTLSGVIKLRIEALTYLHIGSGEYSESKGLIYKSFFRTNGICTIPGSSLKGCIRTIAEMVSHGCMGVSASKEYQNKIPVKKFHHPAGPCILCDMFGSKWQKSKVVFGDFKLSRKADSSPSGTEIIRIAKSFKPNVNAKSYKDERGYLKGYKVYLHGKDYVQGDIAIEAVPPSSVFEGEIIYHNLSPTQLKLLCFSLGLSGLDLKIGYAKNHNLGSVRISADKKDYVNMALEYEKIDDREIENNIKILKNMLKFE